MPIEQRVPPARGTKAWADTIRLPSTYSGTRGPGTFVVAAWHQIWPADMTARTPKDSSVGATKLPIEMIEGTATADIAVLYSSLCPLIAASRFTGSGSPTGRSTKTAD